MNIFPDPPSGAPAGIGVEPFGYLAALESGLTPDSLVEDAPIDIGGWSPENFEPGYKGRIPAREALAESIDTAARWRPGSEYWTNFPIELAGAHAAFANGEDDGFRRTSTASCVVPG
jgi:hypothetical protein